MLDECGAVSVPNLCSEEKEEIFLKLQLLFTTQSLFSSFVCHFTVTRSEGMILWTLLKLSSRSLRVCALCLVVKR